MPNDIGTTSAPSKADAKRSGNVSGAQAQQMIVKRQSEAPASPASSESVVQAAKPAKESAPTSEPSTETPQASQPEKAPEAKPEATEKLKAEAPEPDDVLSQLSPEQQEKINKRIGKEIEKTRKAVEEAERLRALVNATPKAPEAPVTPVPVFELSAENPLANAKDMTEIIAAQKSAEEAKFWAQEQLDNEVKEVRVGDKVYTDKDLKAVVRNSDRLLTKYVPERLQYMQAKQNMDRQVAEMFPWIHDQSSQEYITYQKVLKDPALSRRPDASWIAAVQVTGLADVVRRKQAAGDRTAALPEQVKARAPASQTGGSGAPGGTPREASSSRKVAELEAEMTRMRGKKGVSGKDVAAYLARMESSR